MNTVVRTVLKSLDVATVFVGATVTFAATAMSNVVRV